MNNFEIDDLNSLPDDDNHKIINNELLSKIYSYLIYSIFAFFILVLIYFSVIEFKKYNKLSINNRLITTPIIAPRGVIFSRNMTQLSYNIPTFNLYINTQNLSKSHLKTDISILSKILAISSKKITKIVQSGLKSGYVEIPIETGISNKNEILISSNSHLYGVSFKQTSYVKFRYNNLLSHILGYTGPISEQELLNNKNMNPYDIVGRYGIEESFNNYLTGKDGYQINEVDTYGNAVSKFAKVNPIPGNNIQLTVSATIQKKLQQLIIQNIKQNPNHVTGAVGIVENINTGGILAMVSYPTFNNNNFEGLGISQSQYSKLLNNPDTPLLNRAISTQQPIGSIMKTILLSAGLQTGAITKNTTFSVPGTFNYNGTVFENYARINWGEANIEKCLQYSINVFAFKAALKIGIGNFVKYEKLFGLGKPTGIQLPGESSGIIANPKTKLQLTGQPWYPGDLLNSAIGQGYTEVTPIQVANFISAIANGGKLMRPRIVKAIYNYKGNLVKKYNPTVIRSGFVSSKNLDIIKTGMYLAVQHGIDIAAQSTIADNAGKSGTAQFGQESYNPNPAANRYLHSHSWMSSFAPYNKPQIAMVVFEENGGVSTYSAEVVKNFMNWYFGTYLKH